jgi:hypothetical protein
VAVRSSAHQQPRTEKVTDPLATAVIEPVNPRYR